MMQIRGMKGSPFYRTLNLRYIEIAAFIDFANHVWAFDKIHPPLIVIEWFEANISAHQIFAIHLALKNFLRITARFDILKLG